MQALAKHLGFPVFTVGNARRSSRERRRRKSGESPEPGERSTHMLGRRSFLIGCGGMAVAPALAHLTLLLTGSVSLRSPPTHSAASTALPGVGSPEIPVLRIDGWDAPDDSGSAAHREVWIHINSSWKAAWR
jgi:hypothetical protein